MSTKLNELELRVQDCELLGGSLYSVEERLDKLEKVCKYLEDRLENAEDLLSQLYQNAQNMPNRGAGFY